MDSWDNGLCMHNKPRGSGCTAFPCGSPVPGTEGMPFWEQNEVSWRIHCPREGETVGSLYCCYWCKAQYRGPGRREEWRQCCADRWQPFATDIPAGLT